MSDMSAVLFPLTARASLLLLQKSENEGRTPSQLIEDTFKALDADHVHPDSDTTGKFLKEAVERAKRIQKGQEFTLRGLFSVDFNQIPSPTAFGRLFKVELEQQGIANHVGRDNTAKMAKYQRL